MTIGSEERVEQNEKEKPRTSDTYKYYNYAKVYSILNSISISASISISVILGQEGHYASAINLLYIHLLYSGCPGIVKAKNKQYVLTGVYLHFYFHSQ